MNLRFIQNIIMTGLSNSFIANTDSVLCILCIFCGSTLSLPQILLSFCFHIIIIATVQRKFFLYLLPILTSISRRGRSNTFSVSLHFNLSLLLVSKETS